MDGLLKEIQLKKKILDKYEPLANKFTANMDEWYKIELTYTSNAIEGNTLTRQETAQIVEKGITVKGKSITEHLEAINHAKAYEYIKKLHLKSIKKINKRIILDIHTLILKNIDNMSVGIYRNIPVRIAGSRVTLPNPVKVSKLMDNFIAWLHNSKQAVVKTAVDAHFKLVSIHPFIDGNGRVARLLMNLILTTAGYPPAIIPKEERNQYITSIEKGQLSGDLTDYYSFMYLAVKRSLDIYLKTLEKKGKKRKLIPTKLMTIGELAEKTSETVSTIRFWTKEGLLKVKSFSPGGYQLYGHEVVETVKEIRRLKQKKRLTISELKRIFS